MTRVTIVGAGFAALTAIRRLRAKVDDDFAPKLIHTLRGMGYVMEIR